MLNNISQQGVFAIFCAVAGVVAGIYLSRQFKSRKAETDRKKRNATPPVYASRQEMRKVERQQAKK